MQHYPFKRVQLKKNIHVNASSMRLSAPQDDGGPFLGGKMKLSLTLLPRLNRHENPQK